MILILLAITSSLRAQSPQNPLPITGPTTITQPGYYRLTKNITFTAASGNIITVKASNVTIDFNKFHIRGPATNTSQSVIGVYGNEVGNLTIRNGAVLYCDVGIELTGIEDPPNTHNTNNTIDNMRISHCLSDGIFFPHTSPASVISNCQFSQIGGSTKTDVIAGLAIYSLDFSLLIKDNIIHSVKGAASSTDQSYGIYGGIAVRNTISYCHFGVAGSSKYQNNLTYAVSVPFSGGGTDAGGNY